MLVLNSIKGRIFRVEQKVVTGRSVYLGIGNCRSQVLYHITPKLLTSQK